MEKKKVVIKIHEDGQIEVIRKDKDIIVEMQASDGSTFNLEDLKGNKLYGKDDKFGGRLGGLGGIENRRNVRINKQYIIRFVEKKNLAVKYEVTQIENISKGGMSFCSTTAFKPNTELLIELKAPYSSEIAHLIGVVLENTDRMRGRFFRNRIKFVNLSSSAKVILEKMEEDYSKVKE
ncbi:MAG: PilZ domain-containing protein [Candidatus Omnitrophica bacterium]|nr:PilZ domain-containing protein [Candidatus Omnitrophota bacterium]